MKHIFCILTLAVLLCVSCTDHQEATQDAKEAAIHLGCDDWRLMEFIYLEYQGGPWRAMYEMGRVCVVNEVPIDKP
jgi:hypothetical protein